VIPSSLALEWDDLDHLYLDIADAPDLRYDYKIDEADFSNPFADLGQFSRVIARYSTTISFPYAVQWQCLSRLDSSLRPPPLELIGGESLVFSSTQVEMIALISAFEYISQNAIGEEVQVYSDSLGALAFRVNGYWKSSLSDTKKHLRIAYAQACQTSTIQLIHVHGHRGIWQNEYADKAAKNALKTLTTTNVNADTSQADSFARAFYLVPHPTPNNQSKEPSQSRPDQSSLERRLLWRHSSPR